MKLQPPISSGKTNHPPIKKHMSRALLFNSNVPNNSQNKPLTGAAAAAAVAAVSAAQHSSSANTIPPVGRKIERTSSMTLSGQRTLNRSITVTGKEEADSVMPRAGSYTGLSPGPRSGSFTGPSPIQRSLSRLGSRASRGVDSDYNNGQRISIEEERWTADNHHAALTWDDEGRILAMQV